LIDDERSSVSRAWQPIEYSSPLHLTEGEIWIDWREPQPWKELRCKTMMLRGNEINLIW
jgi:hypothetical protein